MSMQRVKLTSGTATLFATLRDTATARQIYASLPVEAPARTWGEEVYFPVRLETELEADARDVVTAGEWAFWVEGKCVAIGFGPTPISEGNEIRLAAATNIWADCEGDVTSLKSVQAGDIVRLDAI